MTMYADSEHGSELASALQDTTLVPWPRINRITYVVPPMSELLTTILVNKKFEYNEIQRDVYFMAAEEALMKFEDIQ
jgi:hypothetical protein